MEKEFIPYEQALALKELEFDEPCFGTWDRPDKLWIGYVLGIDYTPDDTILTPTFSQAFRWFREKYDLHYQIEYMDEVLQYGYVITEISTNTELEEKYKFTYEEAELECLKKLIEIVKEKFAQVKN